METVSFWFFGGLSGGHVLALSVVALGTLLTVVQAHRVLRTRRSAVLVGGNGNAAPSRDALFGRTWGSHRIVSLTLLHARLILRNKRSRQMMITGLVMLGSPLGILLLQENAPLSMMP